MLRALALLLTVFTGFSGLVYEVAWQRYLATLLGSHSEATAAVLGIFLAGLSLGYAVFGSVTRRIVASAAAAGRPPRLLMLYGLIEAAIGVYALVFPSLFSGVQRISTLVPHAAGGLGFAFDVALATLLVAPPTILMGGTIPILTQALARSLADATRFHAFVYAFNTVGAFAGALAAGFFLIPALGLVRVLAVMSALNLGAGAVFVAMGLRGREVVSLASDAGTGRERVGFAPYAAVALLSGFALMAIQTVVIRLGGLAFGASQFTFSTVVAAFVLCIALGSLGVSVLSRIGYKALLVTQWGVAVLFFLLYTRLDEAPYWAHVMRTLFRDTDAAFYPYYFAGFVGLLLVIGLPVILSGATLPLIFSHLRHEVGDLGAVAGRIYSWNTVGSLLGALLGGYALLFWLDLHHVYRLAVAALVVAAVTLTVRVYRVSLGVASAFLLIPALTALVWLPAWDSELLSIGLFRYRRPEGFSYEGPAAALRSRSRGVVQRFYDDDPVASVEVREWKARGGKLARSIVSNGKSDGSTADDYTTMALAALLPALLADGAERAFVIGYGTGVSVGELAALRETREVVVAEISPGVTRAAPLFDFANLGASKHSKVRIVRSDAYRALLRSEGRFDLIVSEPSNPWVTGVEMLYSREFLQAARERLTPGGVYAQWYHQYDTDAVSVELVLRTYAAVFDEVAVWYAQGSDLLLLGFESGSSALDVDRLERRAAQPDFARGLARCGIASLPALLAHELLPLGVVGALDLEGPVHTLTHPRLNHVAGRAFFRGGVGRLPFTGFGEAAAVGARHSLLRRLADRSGGQLSDAVLEEVVEEACEHRLSACTTLLASWQLRHPGSARARGVLEKARRGPGLFGGQLRAETLESLTPLLERGDEKAAGGVELPMARRASRHFAQYYHHAVPFDPAALLGTWGRCRAARGPAACRQGLEQARSLLARGAAAGSPREESEAVPAPIPAGS